MLASTAKLEISPGALKAVRSPTENFFQTLDVVGPGTVVTGSVIGHGAFVNKPVQAPRFAFMWLWTVIITCIFKCFLPVVIHTARVVGDVVTQFLGKT